MQFPQWWLVQQCTFGFLRTKYRGYGVNLLTSLFAVGIMQPTFAQPIEPVSSDVSSKNLRSPLVMAADITVAEAMDIDEIETEALESEAFPTPQLESIEISPILFNAPPPPDRQGSPRGRRAGGASRGNCLNYEGLTALVPVTEGKSVADRNSASGRETGEVTWGQTTAANPTLWFYSPAGLMSQLPIELVVQDGSDQYISIRTFEVDAEAGVVALQVFPSPEVNADATTATYATDALDTSDTTTALPVDSLLPWTFAIYCDSERLTNFISVKGTIQRVTVEGVDSFSGEVDVNDRARSLSQARAFAAAGIWHDALTILATLRNTYPTDAEINALWTSLLQQADLEFVASESIQDCCSAEE